MLLFLCSHENPSKDAKLIMHAYVGIEERFTVKIVIINVIKNIIIVLK